MRLAWILIAALGCSSSPKQDTTTTTTTTSSAAPTTAEPAPPAEPTGTAVTTTTTTTTSTAPMPARPAAAPTPAASAGVQLYSCFSYVAAGSRTKRHNCMKTDDCPSYIEQAKSIKGIRDLTGCASVATVWCFHQVVKSDPEGVDICQQTLDDCKLARATAVKAKESVDTECAQR